MRPVLSHELSIYHQVNDGGDMAALDCAALPEPQVPLHRRDWIRLAPEALSPNPCPSNAGVHSAPDATLSPTNGVVSLVAGSFAAHVSQIWSGERITEYLTATDTRRHVWHAWLSSEGLAFRIQNPMSAELAYARLTYARGKDLILQAYACRPAGLAKALSRLGTRARSPKVYRALVRALEAGGAGAKLLCHSSDLSDELILGAATLPPGLNEKAVLDLLRSGRVGFKSVGFFMWTLARLEKLKGSQVSQAILAAPKPLEAMWEVIQDLPFPDPPWPGDDCLRPVASRQDLERIARDLKNCLTAPLRQRETVLKMINGDRYFYEWCGREPALLEFCRIGSLGWYLLQASGRQNRGISDREREDILRRLSEIPSICPAWNRHYQHHEDLADLLTGLEG